MSVLYHRALLVPGSSAPLVQNPTLTGAHVRCYKYTRPSPVVMLPSTSGLPSRQRSRLHWRARHARMPSVMVSQHSVCMQQNITCTHYMVRILCYLVLMMWSKAAWAEPNDEWLELESCGRHNRVLLLQRYSPKMVARGSNSLQCKRITSWVRCVLRSSDCVLCWEYNLGHTMV
jgi:hypothetical protein